MSVSVLDAAKHTLQEIATQAYSLAMGLQNAAPTQTGSPPPSVQYLLETSLMLNKLSKKIDELSTIATDKKEY